MTALLNQRASADAKSSLTLFILVPVLPQILPRDHIRDAAQCNVDNYFNPDLPEAATCTYTAMLACRSSQSKCD